MNSFFKKIPKMRWRRSSNGETSEFECIQIGKKYTDTALINRLNSESGHRLVL